MKVSTTVKKSSSLETQFLQFQIAVTLSQFQEILSTYTNLLLLFAEYPYLFNFLKNEPIPLKGKNKLFKNNFITQDPARDGGNWYGYCGQNPLTSIDFNGLESSPLSIYVNMSERGLSVYSESKNNIAIITFSGETNSKGAALGTMSIYSPEQFDSNHNLNIKNTNPLLTVPIVSGSNFKNENGKIVKNSRINDGLYVGANKRAPNSEILNDDQHGGQGNPIWDIPGSDNRAVHQGNNAVTNSGAWTEGCPAVTGNDTSSANSNYESFKNIMGDKNLDIVVTTENKNYGLQGETYYAEKK